MTILLLYSPGATTRVIAPVTGEYVMDGKDLVVARSGYVIPVTTGVYDLSGFAAGFKRDLKLPLQTGQITYTGNTLGLVITHKLSIASGAYTIVGNAAGLIADRKLHIAFGAYQVSGYDARIYFSSFRYDDVEVVYALAENREAIVEEELRDMVVPAKDDPQDIAPEENTVVAPNRNRT